MNKKKLLGLMTMKKLSIDYVRISRLILADTDEAQVRNISICVSVCMYVCMRIVCVTKMKRKRRNARNETCKNSFFFFSLVDQLR